MASIYKTPTLEIVGDDQKLGANGNYSISHTIYVEIEEYSSPWHSVTPSFIPIAYPIVQPFPVLLVKVEPNGG